MPKVPVALLMVILVLAFAYMGYETKSTNKYVFYLLVVILTIGVVLVLNST